jgi:hypothetical protein
MIDYESRFRESLSQLKAEGRYREFAELKRIRGEMPDAIFHSANGSERRVTVWCSNDYLGMGQHPQVLAAMHKALDETGAGSGGTRNIAGTSRFHVELEGELARLHGKDRALLFNSGYMANEAALSALGHDTGALVVPLIQLVALFRGGEPVRMGKRSGSFVTLEDLFDEVGADATRYFYLARKCDQHLDFDLDLAKSQSNDNPVYYIQYAHARVCSVMQQWGGDAAMLAQADLSPLASPQETALMQRLLEFPDVIEQAARELAPHALAFQLRDLAGEFHSYYNATHFLVPEEPVKLARLALVSAVRQVLRNGLALLGVGAPEKM